MPIPGRRKDYMSMDRVGTSQLPRRDTPNPLLNVCPVCQAKRYYKCWVWTGLAEGRYLTPLAKVHPERLRAS